MEAIVFELGITVILYLDFQWGKVHTTFMSVRHSLKLCGNQWQIQDFPLGGCLPVGGGANLRCIHFSVKKYAKTKEIDPVGGVRASSAPPGSANGNATMARSISITVMEMPEGMRRRFCDRNLSV